MGSVVDIETLLAIREDARSEGKRVVFTNGCFDLLHRGHVEYLAKARAMGDLLVVGVNDDASVRRIRGEKRPIVGQEDRAAVVAALAVVDYVCLFGQDTPLELIRRLKPDVLVKGGDWALEAIVGREIVEASGGRVEVVDVVPGRGVTQIIGTILDSYRR